MSLVDVKTVAEHLAVTPGWVYDHANEIGARRLGTGPKARLRFDLAEVDERVAFCSASRRSESLNPAETRASSPRRRRPAGTNVELLPIRGSRRVA